MLLIGGVNRLSRRSINLPTVTKNSASFRFFERFLQNKCILSFRFRAHVNMTLNGRGAGPGSGPTFRKITNENAISQ